MADEPLLNLDTLFRRSTIAVDGVAYELFSPDELSVLASHQFGVWGRRIEALGKSDNADNGVELGALMDKAASAAVVAMPAPAFPQLAAAPTIATAHVFLGLPLPPKLR